MNKNIARLRRAKSTRCHIRDLGVPRLSVLRTGQHLYAQVFTADGSKVLAAASTVQADVNTVLLGLTGENLDRFIESSPRAATAFFFQLVQVFIKRLRDSGDLVAEVTRWGLEATGLDIEHTSPG